MTYTVDWFDSNVPLWANLFGHLRDKPTKSLEIGSFEGRSADWMLKSILIHPDSCMTCIDPHGYKSEIQVTGSSPIVNSEFDMEEVYESFVDNMKDWVRQGKLIYLRKHTPEALRKVPLDYFDTVYIDGSHIASAVLSDGVGCWPLMKVGGIMVFDDYEWITNAASKEDPELWKPRLGIDAFLDVFRTRYEMLHKGSQVALKKLS